MLRRPVGEFVDRQKREAVRQLGLVKKLLEGGGLKVDDRLSSNEAEHDPYIFCRSPERGNFGGLRIYKIGTDLAMKVQKEAETHPYGSAYPLPIESMFYDFLADEADEAKAGRRVIEAVVGEVKRFFEKSLEAERDRREREDDRAGNLMVRSGGTDYSAMIHTKS